MEKIDGILQELRPELDYHASKNFIEDGLLDSFDLVSLIYELETHFNISIDALDIIPDNFVSAQSIAELVKKNGGVL